MKTRILASVVLLPLLLLIVLAAPKFLTGVLFGLMAAIAAYELLSGTGLLKHKRLQIYAMVCAFFCVLWCGLGISYAWLLLVVIAFWMALMAEVMLSGMQLPFDKIALCVVAGVLLPLLLGSLVRIHGWALGRFYILVPFGMKFGKHRLAPVISPKKSVEGVFGGVAGAILGMVIYCLVLQLCFKLQVNYLAAVLYGAVGAGGAVFGDLCFSVVKRQTGIKDYGNLIPGHGGILDRFDSMMIVGPLAELLLLLLPIAV